MNNDLPHSYPHLLPSFTEAELREMLQQRRRDLERPIKIPDYSKVIPLFMEYLDMTHEEVQRWIEQVYYYKVHHYTIMGINRIEFELRSRQKPELKNSKQELADKRANTPIRDVIAHFAGLPSRARPGSLIPCPFPDHKDGTASFMIYDKSNTCRCFGCNK